MQDVLYVPQAAGTVTKEWSWLWHARSRSRWNCPSPHGAYLLSEQAEAVFDFNAPQRPDGSRPQQIDKETGLPIWQVAVLDADPEASNRDKTVVVKLIASHQPVPPTNTSGLPFTPVKFTGLTLTPWIDDNGRRPKLAWSFRATGFEEATSKPATQKAA